MNTPRIEMDQHIYENRATLQIHENPELGLSEEDLYQNSVPIRPRIDPSVLPKPLEKEARSKNDGEAPTAKWKMVAAVALIVAIVGLLLLAAIAGIFFLQTGSLEQKLEEIKASFEANKEAIEFSFHNLSGRWDSNFTDLNSALEQNLEEIKASFEANIEVSTQSCKEQRHRGFFEDGIYDIGNSESHQKVFCDMFTSGGGWTLVASIHDDDMDGKCTSEDKWANINGGNQSSWANNETFGAIDSVTEADYKNAAFYTMKASDVMIWQVPNGVKIDNAKAAAKAIYHTENSILRRKKYGGNLANLYKSAFAAYKTPTPVALIFSDSSNRSQQLKQLVESIPDWYNYIYDDPSNKTINDGGNDMFDGGNRVFYSADNIQFIPVIYGINQFGDDARLYQISSYPYHPFSFFMWIGNQPRKLKKFAIKVESYTGADGSGSFDSYEGARSYGSWNLYYVSFNIYGAGADPSICGVLLYVKNELKWSSIPPTSFQKDLWTTITDPIKHSLVVDGYPANILMGYLLLSRSAGMQVHQEYVDNVMDQLLRRIDAVDTTGYGFNVEGLSAPVRFTSGSPSQVLANIPPAVRASVSPGFIQFGSLAPDSGIMPLCPAVRVNDWRISEYVCLGGIDLASDASYCGDFAGWGGIGRSSDQHSNATKECAHYHEDLNSTFLIFVR